MQLQPDDTQPPAHESRYSNNRQYDEANGESEMSEEKVHDQNGEYHQEVLEQTTDDNNLSTHWGHREQLRMSFLAGNYPKLQASQGIVRIQMGGLITGKGKHQPRYK